MVLHGHHKEHYLCQFLCQGLSMARISCRWNNPVSQQTLGLVIGAQKSLPSRHNWNKWCLRIVSLECIAFFSDLIVYNISRAPLWPASLEPLVNYDVSALPIQVQSKTQNSHRLSKKICLLPWSYCNIPILSVAYLAMKCSTLDSSISENRWGDRCRRANFVIAKGGVGIVLIFLAQNSQFARERRVVVSLTGGFAVQCSAGRSIGEFSSDRSGTGWFPGLVAIPV